MFVMLDVRHEMKTKNVINVRQWPSKKINQVEAEEIFSFVLSFYSKSHFLALLNCDTNYFSRL